MRIYLINDIFFEEKNVYIIYLKKHEKGTIVGFFFDNFKISIIFKYFIVKSKLYYFLKIIISTVFKQI